jgi:D-ribose pyranase
MRTGGIINAQLARILAELRHTDLIVIADSGLPVPRPGPEVVDLAVVYGLPAFDPVLRAVTREIAVEGASAAEEVLHANAVAWHAIKDAVGVDVRLCSHEALKAQVAGARAVVRTGEATPYANVILRCGVPFG